MGIFDRFRRTRQDNSVLPAEVNQYYQTEQRDRRGVAVLLGIITLVVTLIVASGLFFGGRYAYRKINQPDKPATVQTGSNDGKKGVSSQESSPSANKSPDTNADKPSNSDPAAKPAPTPATPPSNPPSPSGAIPSTGDQTPAGSLPRTGDEGM